MRQVRKHLDEFLEGSVFALADGLRGGLILAIDEATTNVVRHAGLDPTEEIDIELRLEGRKIEIRIWDTGRERSAEECVGLPPGELGESGMGTRLMATLMSELNYERTADGRNLLVMVRDLDRGDAPDADQLA